MLTYDESNRQTVYIRRISLGSELTVSELLDAIEEAVKHVDPSNDVVIDGHNGLVLVEQRLETSEEYDARIAKIKAAKFSVQKRADNSWERQKRRFAKARKA